MRNTRLSVNCVIDFNRILFLKLTENAIAFKSEDIKGLSTEMRALFNVLSSFPHDSLLFALALVSLSFGNFF